MWRESLKGVFTWWKRGPRTGHSGETEVMEGLHRLGGGEEAVLAGMFAGGCQTRPPAPLVQQGSSHPPVAPSHVSAQLPPHTSAKGQLTCPAARAPSRGLGDPSGG